MEPSVGTVIIEAFGDTDRGLVRTVNEDCFLIGNLDTGERWTGSAPLTHPVVQRGPLFAVCDGMGGAAAGHVASKLAVDTLWDEMRQAPATRDRVVYARLLRRAVRVANRRILDEAEREPSRRGMGTTLSAAGLVGNALILAQVGDSRAYVLRGDSLVQVTRDQSVVSVLVQRGEYTLEKARTLPQANVILQAVGIRKDIEVSLSVVELRRGDRLLICSDGLHGPIPDADLVSLLGMRTDPAGGVSALIQAARAAGGPDNITAVVARVSGHGLEPPVGPNDLPRFIELDPMEEGMRALAITSRVNRRLAARAGMGGDPGPPVVPATGQFPAVKPEDESASDPADPAAPRRAAELPDAAHAPSPVPAAMTRRRSLALVAWAVAAAVLLAALALVLSW